MITLDNSWAERPCFTARQTSCFWLLPFVSKDDEAKRNAAYPEKPRLTTLQVGCNRQEYNIQTSLKENTRCIIIIFISSKKLTMGLNNKVKVHGLAG